MIRRKVVELLPVGADGSAVVTKRLVLSRPGIIRAIQVDYQNQPATVDLVLKRDTSAGATIFTNTSSNTDFGPSPVGTTAIDEAGGATAATDGISGGIPVTSGVYFDVAQGDGQTSGNEKIIVYLWIEDCYHKQITLAPVGADGSAVATRQVSLPRPGYISHVKVDYQNQPNTTDIVIYRDDVNGAAMLTLTSSNTDIAAAAVGRPGIDEANGASAATDGMAGGYFFHNGFYIDVAQGDGQTSGDEKIVFDFWYQN